MDHWQVRIQGKGCPTIAALDVKKDTITLSGWFKQVLPLLLEDKKIELLHHPRLEFTVF